MERRIGRRSFLAALGIGAAAAAAVVALDPERALWVPGKKTIFLPDPKRKLTIAELHAQYVQGELPEGFDWYGGGPIDIDKVDHFYNPNAQPMNLGVDLAAPNGDHSVLVAQLPWQPPMWIVPADYDKRLMQQLQESLSVPRAYLELPRSRVGDTITLRMPERYFTSAHLSARGSLGE